MNILRRRTCRPKMYAFYPIGKSLPSRREFVRVMGHNSGIGHVLCVAARQEIQCVAALNGRFAIFGAQIIRILFDKIVDLFLKISRRRCGRPLRGCALHGCAAALVLAQIVTKAFHSGIITLLVVHALLVLFIHHLDRLSWRRKLRFRGRVTGSRCIWNDRRIHHVRRLIDANRRLIDANGWRVMDANRWRVMDTNRWRVMNTNRRRAVNSRRANWSRRTDGTRPHCRPRANSRGRPSVISARGLACSKIQFLGNVYPLDQS